MKIAALYTCFNRRDKTLASIRSLYDSMDFYNNNNKESIDLVIYLTDDGCTDGTAESVKLTFPNKEIQIIKGDGNLYWAGGMRCAWKEAQVLHDTWDYYLLLNDDTILLETCLCEVLLTENNCRTIYGKDGIISGITCSSTDSNIITYGGDVFLNKLTGKTQRLGKSDKPQLVDMTNANIMLVPKGVVDKIGVFHESFMHSTADVDYSLWARNHGIPVLITANISGVCDNDHHDADVDYQRIIKMKFQERKTYYNHPLHS